MIIRHLFGLLTLIALAFFWWLMFQIIWPYTSGRTDIDFLLSKQQWVHEWHYMAAFYLHVFSSLWILAAGFTQFSSYLLRRWPFLHRWVGKIYVGIILLVSGPAALVMAVYASGGWATKASFITLSVVWWWATWLAYRAIREKKVREHRIWMVRSYALTLSAITLRLMQYCLAMYTSLDPAESYTLVAWPSWLLNWFIAEMLLYFSEK